MRNRLLEYSLVVIQFTTIGYVVITTSWKSMPVWALIIITAAGFLALWAIATMRLDNLRATPAPLENARLVTRGPYRFLRHPMYTSLLSVMIPLVVAEFNFVRLALGLLLVIDLVVKLNYEERLLKNKFPVYNDYCMHTRRLIPFIW